MATRGGKYSVEMTEGAVRVRHGEKTLTIPTAPPDDDSNEADFIVRLEDLDHWDAPDNEDAIEIDELQKILDAVERQFEKHGLSVDFD